MYGRQKGVTPIRSDLFRFSTFACNLFRFAFLVFEDAPSVPICTDVFRSVETRFQNKAEKPLLRFRNSEIPVISGMMLQLAAHESRRLLCECLSG